MTASRPGTSFPTTSPLYDSRRAAPGIGFPSCSRELVRAEQNRRDPHDYYAELGVEPSASIGAIRAAARRLFYALHPDTGERPDPERLARVKLIADVLTDPVKKYKYDTTPEGERVMDEVYRSELTKLGVFTGKSARVIREALRPQSGRTHGRYDYFSLGHKSTDALKAQQWYHYLVERAGSSNYRGSIRLLLWDGLRPAWDGPRQIVMVPRKWEPSAFAADALLAKVIGNTGISHLTTAPPQVSPVDDS